MAVAVPAADITAVELLNLKAYLHIDHDEDDSLLSKLYADAVKYLQGAGAQIADASTPRLLVWNLVQQWYDEAEESPKYRRMLNQAKFSGEVSL